MTYRRHILVAAVAFSATYSGGPLAGPPDETIAPAAAYVDGNASGSGVVLRDAAVDDIGNARVTPPEAGAAWPRLWERPDAWLSSYSLESGAVHLPGSYASYVQSSFADRLPARVAFRAAVNLEADAAAPSLPIRRVPADVRTGLQDPVASLYSPHSRRREIAFGLSSGGSLDTYFAWGGATTADAEKHAFYADVGGGPRLGLAQDRPARPGIYSADRSTTPLDPAASRYAPAAFSLLGQFRKKRGLQIPLIDSWRLNAGVRKNEYTPNIKTRTNYVTVERFWENWRTAYSFQVQREAGQLAGSHVMQLDYVFSPKDIVGISFASGREVANFGSLGILKTDVRALSFNAQHAMGRDWAVNLQAAFHDHGELPNHRAFRIAFKRTF
jgi:YaiO family outer membrane protein